MIKQLYWEDVQAGNEVPVLAKVATTQMLVKFAGASGDMNPLHFDNSFAAAQGVGKPIVHGALKYQWLTQLMNDWIGEAGTLKKISCQYRAMDYPRAMKSRTEPEEGETWLCKGKIVKKYIENDEHYVECDIWVQNGKGEVTTPGKAIAVLPTKE